MLYRLTPTLIREGYVYIAETPLFEINCGEKTWFAYSDKEKNDLLYRAILTLKNEEECYSFFQDLCTISELRSMEQRYEVATLLNDGMLYSDILEKTGASSATISRVNRSLLNGAGGYENVLERMKEQEEK